MSDITDLIREALSHPLAGGAVLSWVVWTAIAAYWVKRIDDGKPTSRVTKVATAASLILAVGLTVGLYYPLGILQTKVKTKTVVAVAPPSPPRASQNRGHLELRISEREWACSKFDELFGRYIKLSGVEKVRARAASGDGDYLFLAAMTYDAGLMDLESEPEKKLSLLQLAASTGNSRAMLGLSSYFFDVGDSSDGEKWLLEAQKRGLGLAFLRAAERYQAENEMNVSADVHKVVENLERAAGQGCVGQAAYFLGNLYYFGQLGKATTKQNISQGLDLLKRAATYDTEYRGEALDTIVQHYIYNKDYLAASFYVDDLAKVCRIGRCLYTIGTYYDNKREHNSALQWYHKADEDGYLEAADKKALKARLSELDP